MLENALFESSGRAPTRTPATVLLSTAIHAVIIVTLVLIPLLQPQALPMLATAVGIPLAEIPRPENPVPTVVPDVQPRIQPAVTDFIAPTEIPRHIALVVDAPDLPSVQSYSAPRPDMASLLRPMMASVETALPAAPPPPPAAPIPPPRPTRVSAGAQQANLIHQVNPEYPPLARQARVQGAVILEATITTDGSVKNVRVVSGHPLLIRAAEEAVQQWQYRPTMLNNEPVEVITTITVTFTLQ